MADRQIIFSTLMVRALIEGRKTQDRRVLKPQPSSENRVINDSVMGPRSLLSLAKYKVGDRLYVREAIAKASRPGKVFYRADYEAGGNDGTGIGWHSPIHMPPWATRLTFIVTDVRVHRLQDISEADAVAEGVEVIRRRNVQWAELTPKNLFAAIWNRQHGTGAWDANLWVEALTIEERNIDAGGA